MSNPHLNRPLPKYIPFSEALKRWGFNGLSALDIQPYSHIDEIKMVRQYVMQEGLEFLIGTAFSIVKLEEIKPFLGMLECNIKPALGFPYDEEKEREDDEEAMEAFNTILYDHIHGLFKKYVKTNYSNEKPTDKVKVKSVTGFEEIRGKLYFNLIVECRLGVPFSLVTIEKFLGEDPLLEYEDVIANAFINENGLVECGLTIAAHFVWLERDNLKRFEQKAGIYDHGIDLDKDGEPLPPYLDKDSPYYALEMEIVVKAHEDIIKGWNKRKDNNQWKDVKTKRSVKDRVESWVTYELEKRGIKEPDNIGSFYKRIAALINPIIHKLSPAGYFKSSK